MISGGDSLFYFYSAADTVTVCFQKQQSDQAVKILNNKLET